MASPFSLTCPPPGGLPGPGDTKTLKGLLNHPDKPRLIDAAVSEIESLLNVHNVLRVVPINRHYDVLHKRGTSMTKMLNSLLILSKKTANVGGDIQAAGRTLASRFKGRLTGCERKDQHHYSSGVRYPSSDLAAARMFFCIALDTSCERHSRSTNLCFSMGVP